MSCSAIVLCGGLGRRVGGADKGRLPWGNTTLVESVLERIRPQVDDIVISANRHRDWYAGLGYTVVGDSRPDFQGPLAGLEAGIPHCSHSDILVVCCDTPELPTELVSRLLAPLADPKVDVSFARTAGQDHYLASVIRQRLGAGITHYLDSGERSVRGWHKHLRVAPVDFSDCNEAFLNVNELESKNPP